ncbi:CRE-SYG-1 protein [Aphelenchoides avenae]|nr:CRE-SYG-1 protein [Aphelenchus avenae]
MKAADYLLLLFLTTAGSVHAKQRIAEGPSDTTVRLGETVVLKCRVEDQKGEVQWAKNEFGLGADRQLKTYERYRMVGSVSQGEYHLEIVNASITDDGTYQCHMSATDDEKAHQSSQVARLTVLVQPTPPELVDAPKETVNAVEHQQMEVRCRSRGGRPPARITWAIASDPAGDKILHEISNGTDFHANALESERAQYIGQIMETVSDAKNMYAVTSALLFVPTQKEDGRYLVCLTSHETLGGRHEVTGIKLDVSYKPTVVIHRDDEKSVMKEGGRAVLKCFARAKPMASLKRFWQSHDNRVKQIDQETGVIENLQRKDHGMEVSCVGRNEHGESKTSYRLSFPYGPSILSTTQTRTVLRGEPAHFHCEAEGNPPPKIYWTQKGDTEVKGRGPKFTIDNVQSWDAGSYECTAEVPGFTPKRLLHHLHIKGEPMVKLSEETIYRKDDVIELRCEVHSTPLPNKIIWTKGGRPITDGLAHGRMRLQELQRDYGVESKLTIHGLEETDFGKYRCSAFNEFGNHSMEVDLTYRNLWEKLMQNVEGLPPKVSVGIILALVLLVLCVVLLCCYSLRRGRRNKAKGSGFSDQSSDIMVKCEGMDGYEHPVYSPYHDSIMVGKDYISVPQDANLDYLPPPISTYPHSHYTPSPHMMHNQVDPYNGDLHDRSYGSFTSGGSTSGAVPDMYGGGMVNYPRSMEAHHGGRVLEPLPEVATPETEGAGTPIRIHQANYPQYAQDRPVSRLSTHV